MEWGNKTARFADFDFDLETGELRRENERIHLQDQPSRLLGLLVSRPGQLVTREELRTSIWNGRVVEFDASLNFCVSQVRRALGDDAESPVFIETLPRKGYRFIADVTFPLETTRRSPMRFVRWRSALPVLIAAALLSAAAVLWPGSGRSPSPASEHLKIAVLPIQVLSRPESLELFAQGLTEDLITDLANLGSERLQVVAFSSMREIGADRSDIATLRSELGADYVVRGTLRESEATRRITIRVESTGDGSLAWARRLDRRTSEGLTADTDEIAVGIARSLDIDVPDPPATMRDNLPARAREALLRARWFLNRQTPADSERAISELDSVRSTVEGYAPVWALTAEARTALGRYEVAEAAAREAMRLDLRLADAPYQLGQALVGAGRFEEALVAFERAVELSPGTARYRQALAYQLWRQERRGEAVEHLERARELDPLSTDLEVDLGYLYIEVDRLQGAIQHCERSLVLLPENRWGRLCLLKAHYLVGDIAAALSQARTVLRLQGAAPDALEELDRGDARSDMLTLFAKALKDANGLDGRDVDSDLAREVRSLLAQTHSALQERARRGVGAVARDRPESQRPERTGYERWLDYLWGNPRFEQLLRRQERPVPWAADPAVVTDR